MDLRLQTTRRYTIPTAFQAEEQISYYLSSLFNETDGDLDILTIDVKVKNEGIITTDRTVLQTVVSMIYVAQEPKEIAPLLVDRVETKALAEILQISELSVSFEDLIPTKELVYVPDEDDGRPKADKGLIAVTVFMAAALLMVASAVLYITGGWAAFQQCCINCLFEEVEEEDDYAIAKKSTFQVQSFDEGDRHNGKDIEVTSQAASEITEATNVRPVSEGMLGALSHPNPTAGMGIKTPNRADASGYDSEVNITPLSEATPNTNALGITSMRKLPLMDKSDDEDDDDVEGGLAHLILKRRFKESKAP